MDGGVDKIYQPKPGFVEEKKEPLIVLDSTDSTELWLIQWPINQSPEFNGQQFSLNLEGNGHVGTFECPSGKSYEMISLKSQGQEETVFVSSASEAKVAGKISRHISLVHYPEPNELQKRNILNLSQSQRSSMATSTMSGRRLATPTRSMRPRNSQGMSGYSTPSSRTKSTTAAGLGESSKPPKRKRANDSAQDSGKTTSAVTSTGSVEQSQETKSKKKRKTEN